MTEKNAKTKRGLEKKQDALKLSDPQMKCSQLLLYKWGHSGHKLHQQQSLGVGSMHKVQTSAL